METCPPSYFTRITGAIAQLNLPTSSLILSAVLNKATSVILLKPMSDLSLLKILHQLLHDIQSTSSKPALLQNPMLSNPS